MSNNACGEELAVFSLPLAESADDESFLENTAEGGLCEEEGRVGVKECTRVVVLNEEAAAKATERRVLDDDDFMFSG